MLRSTFQNRVIKCLALAGLTMLATGRNAQAGFSPVNAPSSANEMGHAEILSHTYGGAFVANGVDFTNGSITAHRLDDGNASDMNMAVGAGTDQCWANGAFSVRAVARFAGYQQTLGILEGDAGGSFEALFTVSGTGLNVNGGVYNCDMNGKEFRFARGGGAGVGDMFTSLNLDNFSAADQMVSYKLTGPGGLTKYLLCFEDAGAAQGSDWDYNDLVVEVTPMGVGNVVPLPSAALSGVALLFAAGMWSGRERLKAWLA
jgi:hypothetical protein